MNDGNEIQWLSNLARLMRDRDTLASNSTRAASRRDNLGELLTEYEEDLERAERQQEDAAAETRTAERAVSRVEDRLSSLRKRLDIIKDNDEYRVTLKEITAVEKELQEHEAGLLKYYDHLEKLQENRRQAGADLLEQEKKIADETTQLAESSSGAAARLAELDDEIIRCQKNLPTEIVSRVKQLTGKLPLPVVWIDGGACGGCHARFPAQKAISIAAGHCFERCSGCGRIVVARP